MKFIIIFKETLTVNRSVRQIKLTQCNEFPLMAKVFGHKSQIRCKLNKIILNTINTKTQRSSFTLLWSYKRPEFDVC